MVHTRLCMLTVQQRCCRAYAFVYVDCAAEVMCGAFVFVCIHHIGA